MKHKRLFYTLTIILYVAIVILSFSFLFSVKEVKTDYSMVTNSVRYQQVENKLKRYSGKNLLFVNTDKIVKDLESDNYVIVKEIKKDYPNILIVEIEEREEVFVIESSTHRYYLDKNYFVLKKVDKQKDELSSEMILLDLTNFSNFDFETLQVGETFSLINGWVHNCINEMISVFSDRKNLLEEIKLEGTNKMLGYTIYFKTIQGVEIKILDPNLKLDETKNEFVYDESNSENAGIEEVQEVYKVYSTISDIEKTKGELIVNRLPNGEITVIYTNK